MKRDEEILESVFEPQSQDCTTPLQDLQLSITLNPNVNKIKQSMAEQFINFAEFCAKEFCPTIQNGLVHWTKETYQTNDKIYTTKEVYEIFNSNNK